MEAQKNFPLQISTSVVSVWNEHFPPGIIVSMSVALIGTRESINGFNSLILAVLPTAMLQILKVTLMGTALH